MDCKLPSSVNQDLFNDITNLDLGKCLLVYREVALLLKSPGLTKVYMLAQALCRVTAALKATVARADIDKGGGG